jgi:uncharacterized protein (TIGR03067 family)
LSDLSASKYGPLLQAICYLHARRISAINFDLMHELVEQLRVEPEDAHEAAEALLGARPFCPLGGAYRLASGPGKAPTWSSTAWQRGSVFLEQQIPEDYCYPFLDWLRGARMELTMDRITLSTHVELEVQSSGATPHPPAARVAVRKPIDEPREPLPIRPRKTKGTLQEPSDTERIQGTWEVVDDRRSGRAFPETAGTRLRFDGDRLEEIHEDGTTRRFRFRLRTQQRPTGFDSLPEGRGIWDEFGICRLEGDRLLLCFGGPDEPRPTEFATQPDDACRLVVLQRVGASEAPTR